MHQSETNLGRKITADMSQFEYLPKWEEMVKTEAASTEINLKVDSIGNELNDDLNTEYMIVSG